MSRGVRIYCRWNRDCYNAVYGTKMVRALLDGGHFELRATGCEEGAMCVHLELKQKDG